MSRLEYTISANDIKHNTACQIITYNMIRSSSFSGDKTDTIVDLTFLLLSKDRKEKQMTCHAAAVHDG